MKKGLKRVLVILGIFPFTLTNAQETIVLQPDGFLGKDAEIFNCSSCNYPNSNFGDLPDLNALAWTNSGSQSYIRSLIEFDLSDIPENSTVTQAYLSLYHNPTSIEGQHASLSGSNESIIRRITSSWEENTVTWNTQPTTTPINEVYLSQSGYPTQDYLNIDVTALVQDMVNNPDSSFGFLLKLETETPYRKLVFASSDNHNNNLHPKLELSYIEVAAIPDAISNDDFSVYPNPTNSSIAIKTEHQVESIVIESYDGKLIRKIDRPAKKELIDLSGLSSGVVFVKILNNSNVFTKKVIISN